STARSSRSRLQSASKAWCNPPMPTLWRGARSAAGVRSWYGIPRSTATPLSTRGNRHAADGKGWSRTCCRGCRLARNYEKSPPAVWLDSQRTLMNGPLPAVLCLALGLALAPAAHAAPPATAQTEINYLLGFIENSACEFFRNGSWYDAKKAAAHLRGKYQILASAGRIRTAEDLI